MKPFVLHFTTVIVWQRVIKVYAVNETVIHISDFVKSFRNRDSSCVVVLNQLTGTIKLGNKVLQKNWNAKILVFCSYM